MRDGEECSSALLVQLQLETLMVRLLHEMGRLTQKPMVGWAELHTRGIEKN